MGGEETSGMPFDKETARRYGDRGRATQVRRRTQDDLSCYEGDPVAFMRALAASRLPVPGGVSVTCRTCEPSGSMT